MMTPEQTRSKDERLDETSADSFPASDPPSHSGITGTGQPGERPARRQQPSRQRGDHARPTGLPTSDRHATETAHQWEDEEHPGDKHPGG
jgi:hypothetical protein